LRVAWICSEVEAAAAETTKYPPTLSNNYVVNSIVYSTCRLFGYFQGGISILARGEGRHRVKRLDRPVPPSLLYPLDRFLGSGLSLL
jgi:hypothetical protein